MPLGSDASSSVHDAKSDTSSSGFAVTYSSQPERSESVLLLSGVVSKVGRKSVKISLSSVDLK